MSERPDDPVGEGAEDPQPEPWDPVEVLRERAAETRRERDRSIAELREHLSDDASLELFGLNLDELDD